MRELPSIAPAHSVEAETAVLGALLMEPTAVETVLPVLKIEDFHMPTHQVIYNAIVGLFSESKIADMLSVIEVLRSQPCGQSNTFTTQLDYAGGPYYLTKLTNGVVSTANLLEHCLYVKQYSIKRRLGELGQHLFYAAGNDTEDPLELLAKTEHIVTGLLNELQLQKTVSLKTAVQDTIDKIHEAAKSESDFIGIPSGIQAIDRQTLGFSAPDFIVLAGGPGEGKTTLALQCAENMAKNGIPVGLVSLEMKSIQLVFKMLSLETGIDIQTLRRGKTLNDTQWASINRAADMLTGLKLHLADKGGLSIVDLKAMIYGWVKTYGVQIVFIDYLQLLTVYGLKLNLGTREQEVNYISKQLKAICMDLNIPIIALSQMSRKPKGSEGRRPVISDLRESGALEQDADAVMFCWRPAYHGVMNDENGNLYSENDAFLLIEKYRLGRTGAIPLTFLGGASKFTDRGISAVNNDPNGWRPVKNYIDND